MNMQTAVAVLVSGVVALFGVTSAVLGFIAEANRLKVSDPNDVHIYSSTSTLAESHRSLYAEDSSLLENNGFDQVGDGLIDVLAAG